MWLSLFDKYICIQKYPNTTCWVHFCVQIVPWLTVLYWITNNVSHPWKRLITLFHHSYTAYSSLSRSITLGDFPLSVLACLLILSLLWSCLCSHFWERLHHSRHPFENCLLIQLGVFGFGVWDVSSWFLSQHVYYWYRKQVDDDSMLNLYLATLLKGSVLLGLFLYMIILSDNDDNLTFFPSHILSIYISYSS